MTKVDFKRLRGLHFRVDLRRLILWMSLFFVVVALGNGLLAAYHVQHALLVQHSQEANRAYAQKLGHAADAFFETAAQGLEGAALDIVEFKLDAGATQKELGQLISVTDTFNTVIAADSSGAIFAASPGSEFSVGTHLPAPQERQLLQAQSTTEVSSPFIGPNGRWLTLIAHPLLINNEVAGFIAGTMHLYGGSPLQDALEKLRYQDQSHFYIVDGSGTVVFHPDQGLIGSHSKDLGTLPEIHLHNYAPIHFAGWGVVAQRPIEAAISDIGEIFLRTFYYSLPVFLISLLAIWWLARLIARPLHELADVAANLDDRSSLSRIRLIKGWYVEAALIRRGLMQSFSAIRSRIRQLHLEGMTDPLTGVVNRRGLDTAIEKMGSTHQDVGVVIVDVDHFKSVNDEYGHAAGDDVLRLIAALIAAAARKDDVVARMGGEEFVILLPDTGADAARGFAERLRSSVEQTHFGKTRNVTISAGVAGYPMHSADLDGALAEADAALYRAKAAGRNCVHLAE